MKQDDSKMSLICRYCLFHCWTGQGYKNKMKPKNEYRAVLFNICVFWHTITVWESMWVSHCCIINESILGKRFFNRVAPPLCSFVAIRDSSNEVKPAAPGALTIFHCSSYLDWLDRISLQGCRWMKHTNNHFSDAWLSPIVLKYANCCLFQYFNHDTQIHFDDCCCLYLVCYNSGLVGDNPHKSQTRSQPLVNLHFWWKWACGNKAKGNA